MFGTKRRARQPAAYTRPRRPWTSFDDRQSPLLSAFVAEGSITRTPGPFGSSYAGNGSTAGTYCTTSVTQAGVGTIDSTVIACVFSARATTGVLVSLGRSINATGGFLIVQYDSNLLRIASDDGQNLAGLGTSSAVSLADGLPHAIVGMLRTDGTTRYHRLWADGVLIASGTGFDSYAATTYDRFGVGMLRRSASGNHIASGTRIYDAWVAKGLTETEAQAASADIYTRLYGRKRIWVPGFAAPSGFVAAWARRPARTIGAGVH